MRTPYRYEEDTLVLDCFPLERGCGKGAVVICPGGGYSMVSQREGAPVAGAWNRAGFHAFVVHYTVDMPPLGYRPLQQVGKAVSYVRRRAGEWGIAPGQVAVCGFSAGGHLAASLGALWNRPALFAPGADLELHRPDAMVLAYPVITAGEHSHERSFVQLCGPEWEKWRDFSLEEQVGGHTPPAFLWHTMDDETVPVENTLLLVQALRQSKVPVEVHLYPNGVHGLSLATPDVAQPEKGRHADSHVAGWFGLAAGWLDRVLNP